MLRAIVLLFFFKLIPVFFILLKTYLIDNSSSSHADNCKIIFLVLNERTTFGSNGNFGLPEKNITINLTIRNTTFYLNFYYNAVNI